MTPSILKWPRGQNDLENWSKPSKNPMLVCGKCYISSPKGSVDRQSTTRILDPLILDLSRDESFIEYFAIPQSPRGLLSPIHPKVQFKSNFQFFSVERSASDTRGAFWFFSRNPVLRWRFARWVFRLWHPRSVVKRPWYILRNREILISVRRWYQRRITLRDREVLISLKRCYQHRFVLRGLKVLLS